MEHYNLYDPIHHSQNIVKNNATIVKCSGKY